MRPEETPGGKCSERRKYAPERARGILVLRGHKEQGDECGKEPGKELPRKEEETDLW